MAKRQTIGENPLDGLFQTAVESNETSTVVRTAEIFQKTTYHSPNI